MKLLRRHYGKLVVALLLAVTLAVLWWALPLKPRSTLVVPGERFRIAGFSRDGRTFAAYVAKEVEGQDEEGNGHEEESVQFWDVATGREVLGLNKNLFKNISGEIQLSPDARFVAFLDRDDHHLLDIVDRQSEVAIARLTWCQDSTFLRPNLCFSPDGNTFAYVWSKSSKGPDAVHLWDVSSRRDRVVIDTGADNAIVFSPDSSLLATVKTERDGDGTKIKQTSLWSTATGVLVAQFDSPWGGHIVFSADSKRIGMIVRVPRPWSRRVFCWDIASRKLLFDRPISGEFVSAPNAAPFHAYYCMADTGVNRWVFSLEAGLEKCILRGFDEREKDEFATHLIGERLQTQILQASPDGKWLADWTHSTRLYASWSASLRSLIGLDDFSNTTCVLQLWDLENGDRIGAIPCPNYFDFSPDGNLVAAPSDEHTINIWDIPPRKPLGWFLGLAGLLLLLTLGGLYWQARRRKRQAAAMMKAIPCRR